MTEDELDIDPEEYRRMQKEQGYDIVETSDGDDDLDELAPITFSTAYEKHIEMMRAEGRATDTVDSHKSRLKKFIAWLRAVARVNQTDEIRPEHFNDYKLQRSKNVKKVTVKSHMDTIRVFIRNMEQIRACPENLHDYVVSPTLEGDEGQRSDFLPMERGDPILQYVRKYWWGSKEHAVYELWWAAGIRIGGVHSLDVEDFDPDEQCVELRHRPETGTTLKNKQDGERDVSLTETSVKAIADYLNNPDRHDVKDEFGRNPLITTDAGRASKTHLRNISYDLTQPCTVGMDCPIGRDPEECGWANNRNKATKCPESKAPHALRSGAITRQMKAGIDTHYISERANVGLETLEKHYNEMTERERMEVRREQFDEEYSSLDVEEQEDRLFDN